MSPEALVRGVGLVKSIRRPDGSELEILHGVDVELGVGEHVSIVGRSGSGKSTLLNLLGLLDRPTGGRVEFEGEDAARLGATRRDRLRGDRIGFVFQQFNLLPGRTAVENVEMPLMYADAGPFWRRGRIAREMLDRVGLGHRLDSTPDRLSGGEQQRVAIARALVRAPSLILADEPTGALDLDTGRSVMELLESICAERGSTMVTITHDAKIAARADRVVRIDDGRVLDDGIVAEGSDAGRAEPARAVVA